MNVFHWLNLVLNSSSGASLVAKHINLYSNTYFKPFFNQSDNSMSSSTYMGKKQNYNYLTPEYAYMRSLFNLLTIICNNRKIECNKIVRLTSLLSLLI